MEAERKLAQDLAGDVGVGAACDYDLDLNPELRVVGDIEPGDRGASLVQRRAQRIRDLALPELGLEDLADAGQRHGRYQPDRLGHRGAFGDLLFGERQQLVLRRTSAELPSPAGMASLDGCAPQELRPPPCPEAAWLGPKSVAR